VDGLEGDSIGNFGGREVVVRKYFLILCDGNTFRGGSRSKCLD
jgi:hypothetical protein